MSFDLAIYRAVINHLISIHWVSSMTSVVGSHLASGYGRQSVSADRFPPGLHIGRAAIEVR